MIKPTVINYNIISTDDYYNYCSELYNLKIYTGTPPSVLGLFKALYSLDIPLHAYVITKVE